MANMDMNQYLGAFLDEAGDNLAHLNELLLSAEQNQNDMGIINEIFRVAHTFKGMSATMGFQAMAAMTHAMEDLLGIIRSGERQLDSDDVDILFQCLDTLTNMVDLIRAGGSDAGVESAALIKVLHERKDPSVAAQSGNTPVSCPGSSEVKSLGKDGLTLQEKDWVTKAESQGMHVHELHVVIDPKCMLKSARAYMVVSAIGEMGDILKANPTVDEIEKESFGGEFWLYVASHETEAALLDAASQVSEVRDAEVHVVVVNDAGSFGKELAEDDDSDSTTGTVTPVAIAAPAASGATPAAAQPTEGGQTGNKANKASRTVRVDIGRLDKLMNLVGELVIGRARIERLVQETQLRAFEEPLSQLGRISGDIQELVTKLRMVPVSMVFDRLPRLVRDLSRQMGKEIQLLVEGAETELDRNVIDEIGDPMVHLLRNSLDHGIESPEAREALGKPRQGTITVAAYQEGNGVIIEVRDDGKGMDPEKIKQKALERGVITQEQMATMSNEEAIRLVLLPGFSMAEKITDLSGRGVGTDAVKAKVEALGGQFTIHSKVNEGSRVVIRLPLTLAIVLALLIRVGDETYAVSLENVEETLLVHKKDIRYVHGTPVTTVRGEILPLADLAGILGTPQEEDTSEENPVVVVRVGRDRVRVGFRVDAFVGQQEIVIKPLGKLLLKVKGIAGATILGDGNVALILDASSL